ncbi:catalase family protein [Colwellia sp. BRX10-9]|uniref:catalase family protein n=1 Tax=Colwellia sp. BRX10-9 TaxID=2759839 RepID=UPI0015F41F8D|nr:catalase family protein [Colwellia sp. BRX10-9]MBA6384671.1 catalase family protein [Colwellia sp. BRX10-9]
MKLLTPLLSFLLILAGCSSPANQSQNRSVEEIATIENIYPEADAALGEKLYPHEALLADETADLIEGIIRHRYTNGEARRDVHPKAHGCLNAEFDVLDDLPKSLSQGVFQAGKSYSAWVRFSNGNPDPDRPDIKGDARGMAIKLLSSPAEAGWHIADKSTVQDFILINHPVFPVKEPETYVAVHRNLSSDGFWDKLAIPFNLGLQGSLIGLELTSKKIANPLHTRYWSEVPYQLGMGQRRKAVKYSVRPCTATTNEAPEEAGADYLREAMKTSLDQNPSCMEFLVQLRENDEMSVENSMIEWQEVQAPFTVVARIHFPKQTFDTDAQNTFCENLAFNPWNSLSEHKPLGAMNRMRKVIYERTRKVRREMNSVVTVE